MSTILDLAVLRTLLCVVETGSFGRAAQRIGRSESAVSLQIRKLEEQVGQAVFQRSGRAMLLTEAGHIVLDYARRLLALNDEAMRTLSTGSRLAGCVTLGAPQDVADTWLPAILAQFAFRHPGADIRTQVARSPVLLDRLARGEIDLVLAFSGPGQPEALWSADLPMCWIGRPDFTLPQGAPVPLAIFDPPCAFRSAATAALDRKGIAWSVAFASGSLAGLWSAVHAGLGITVRTPIALPASLAALDDRVGLPELPAVRLGLHAAPGGRHRPVVERLGEALMGSLEASLRTAL